jgi:hypothetical protein
LPVPDKQIAVIAERLNGRSGPGVSQAVVGQVVGGTRLVILGNAVDWWYVQLPDGETGWVLFHGDPEDFLDGGDPFQKLLNAVLAQRQHIHFQRPFFNQV